MKITYTKIVDWIGAVGTVMFYPIIGIALSPKTKGWGDDSFRKKKLINHEAIHVAQIEDIGFMWFIIHYLWEFFNLFLILKDSRAAYFSVSYEKEAYTHEGDFDYLSKRKKLANLNYIHYGMRML